MWEALRQRVTGKELLLLGSKEDELKIPYMEDLCAFLDQSTWKCNQSFGTIDVTTDYQSLAETATERLVCLLRD